ncbi:hypothetical protein LJC58_09030 [Lachnospiraceae bacterium OttesenSCG-928-D06]|nr:hypothetical protein [Lachnospiraceae bacterium OttesenSCG-928-D06]
MFKIRYKIFADEELEDYEISGENGYFELTFVDEIYGIYISEDIDIFSVSIYWWFYYLLEALDKIQDENYVLICDIETSNTWIEIKRDTDILNISEVSADKPNGSTAVECTIMPNLKYEYWKDKKILFEDFKLEILSKAREYLEELKSLNVEKHSQIINLEMLIIKIQDKH